MIILISGATHTGKTRLAQRLVEQLHFSCLSIDHLKMGLIRSGQTELTPEDDRELTGYLWPIVREMIKTAIENRQNLIVEGCYIPFRWRDDLEAYYLKEIRYLCLVMTDGYIDAHFSDILAHGSDIEARLDDSGCTIPLLKQENRYYEDGCRAAGLPMLCIDGDYEAAADACLQTFL